MTERTLEADGSEDFGPCTCCGKMSRTVWGYISNERGAEAVYYVQWTLGAVDRHGANFDLIVGEWGEAPNTERQGVSLAFRWGPEGPSFMVIDAETRPLADHTLVGTCLRRDQVVGTPIAKQSFGLVDTIFLMDDRIAELRGA